MNNLARRALFAAVLSIGATNALTADAATLTPQKYRAKVTAICEAVKAEAIALPEPQVATDLAPYFEKTTKIAANLLAKIKAVPPPASLKSKIASALATGAKLNAGMRVMVSEMSKATDPEKTFEEQTARLKPLDESLSAAFRAAGLESCA